jgi:hypothetical protein
MTAWVLCAVCHMRQRSRAGGFIESDGGKMFEHLPKIRVSLRPGAFANLFERYRNSRNHGRTDFLGWRKDVTSLPKVSKLVWGKLGGNVRI